MLSELFAFSRLGFHHVASFGALDHILFLLVLAAIYRPKDWRDALWVVTAFTVGHSVTLALSVSGVLRLPTDVVEFLIPVTIVITAADNIARRKRGRTMWAVRYRAVFAGVFGLVHGAGFANYLRSLFVDRIALPLLGFNLGIEAAQIVVLAGSVALLTTLDASLARVQRDGTLRMRVVTVSLVVGLVATRWAAERAPW